MEKPRKRSSIRIFAGTIYYTLKRQCYWHFSGTSFAKKSGTRLPIEIFAHKTPLRRKLKNVDMWMQENKITNLKIAVKALDGITVEPGQTFSLWRQLGKPTRKRGFLDGMVLHNGTVRSGVGGGLCQLSNLLFWITLHTPLTVTERWRHGYDVFPDVRRNQPFGSGATCAYPNIDLQIKNNTEQAFQLALEVTSTDLIGIWLSGKPIEWKYEVCEKNHEIRHEWWGGYTRNNKIFRKILNAKTGKKTGEEFITENHAIMMYEPLLEQKSQTV